jgi:hypothetical protein
MGFQGAFVFEDYLPVSVCALCVIAQAAANAS